MRIELDGGDWVDLREVQFGDIRFVTKNADTEMDQTALLLTRIITAWSYDRAIDEAGVDALSMPVMTRLNDAIQGMSVGTEQQTRPLGNGSTSSSRVSTNGAKRGGSPARTTSAS